MRPLLTPFCFIVQVGTPPSLNCKRSNNAFLLLLPSPSVLLSVTADCVRVAKLLLMCGDVEENPGPTDGTDVTTLSDELRTVIKSITSHVDSRHDELKKVLYEVKSSQTKLEKTVSDINSRLAAVEARVNLLDENQEVQVHQVVTDTVRVETAELRSRLDNFEDRSRRDNLIFYGLEDTAEESWAESEEKVRALISASLESVIPEDSISRAHRLGAYVPKKCRPVIVKFCSFKITDAILSKKSKLKGTKISISEDFCKATRNSRKKLIDYGKASGQKYTIRYNKLFINKKCFVYCAQTDSICEISDNSELESPG
ncbi:uncharacterized protein LOC144173705 [Haemaphysalis longicornis]